MEQGSSKNTPDFKPVQEVRNTLSQLFDAPPQSRVSVREANAREIKDLDEALKQAQVNKFNSDNRSRVVYGVLIFLVTKFWLITILYFVYQAGKQNLKLSDAVLITLITTTTASVFGFFLLVVNYLFNKDKST